MMRDPAVPKYALVKFSDGIATHLCTVNDIKSFNPVSCQDFVKDKDYDVKWQKSLLSFDGFYPARIWCLTVTIPEMMAKIKKNSWKKPMNLTSFECGAQLPSSPPKKKSNKLKETRAKASASRAADKAIIMSGELSRMDNIVNNLTKSNPHSVSVPEVTGSANEEKEPTNINAKCVATNSKQVNFTKIDERTCHDSINDDELDSTDAVSTESDSDDLSAKFVELDHEHKSLKKKYTKLKENYDHLSQLHSSCAGTISFADKAWKKTQQEFEEYKVQAQKKITEIAVANVRLKLELDKKQTDFQSSPHTLNTAVKSMTAAASSDSSPNGSSSVTLADKPKSKPETPKEKMSVKRKCTDELDPEVEVIARRVCDDLTGNKRLDENDEQVILDGEIGINATFWKKKLRTASTDNKFINLFPPALWKFAELQKRRISGSSKDPGTKAATPSKLNVILGAFEGRLMAEGATSEEASLRRKGARKTLERKFIDFSRKDKAKKTSQEEKQD